ncbi:MAG: TonB-dependent receptor [Gemmatimonadota bacterium]
MQDRGRVGFLAVLLVAALSIRTAPAFAQKGSASITGRVISTKDQAPIPGARVFLATNRKWVKTDSIGRFVFLELKPGTHHIEASLIGYAPLSATLELADGERKDVEFRTDTLGQLLPTIFVEGEPQPQLIKELTKFERRMVHGSGRFITRDDIRQRNPMRMMDLLRFLPGVRVACREFSCEIRLNTDPSNCPPAIFMDDVQTTQSVLDGMLPSDVAGIEIYRGPSETPPELNNDKARCGGAIALWTRRGLSH